MGRAYTNIHLSSSWTTTFMDTKEAKYNINPFLYSAGIQFLRGQPGHNTRPHTRLPPSFLGMDATTLTSQLNAAFYSQAACVLMRLAYLNGILSMGVGTTRHWQTSGRLVLVLNICIVLVEIFYSMEYNIGCRLRAKDEYFREWYTNSKYVTDSCLAKYDNTSIGVTPPPPWNVTPDKHNCQIYQILCTNF